MPRVAAVDCGTNTIRLLIADLGGGQLREVDRRLTIVRLGQGVDATGRFAPEALIRTFAACDEYAATIRALDVERIRFVATSAARDVTNADEFFAGVRKRFRVEPEVITGTEEAVLSFRGATNGLTGVETPYLVADIGGGSTELILGDDHGVEAAQSLDMGSVRMTERHLHSDPPTPDQLAAATADIDSLLEATIVPLDRSRTLIGLAGTFTTVAALALDLPDYDRDAVHHARIDSALLESTTHWLIGSTRAERAARRTIHPGRVDVIGAGALILARLRHHLPTDGVLVSEHDILDGIALGLAEE
jgi:exopolyphosphatase / guanosine-5'-triphosphate,3'-diphosphate pyrophosphatase